MTQIAAMPLLQKQGFRQFAKFCIIGASSATIDVLIAKFLTYRIGWHWAIAQSISFVFAVTNGYIWNSLWTFRGQGAGRQHEKYVKFVGINVVGLLLNLIIMKSVFFAITGRIVHQGNPDPTHWNIAKAIAIVCVSLWNFTANKKWTFGGP